MKGMTTCKICGRDFPLMAEDRYTSIDRTKGLSISESSLGFSDKDILYDSFDCPHCGCQYIAQERKELFSAIADTADEYEGNNKEEE